MSLTPAAEIKFNSKTHHIQKEGNITKIVNNSTHKIEITAKSKIHKSWLPWNQTQPAVKHTSIWTNNGIEEKYRAVQGNAGHEKFNNQTQKWERRQ